MFLTGLILGFSICTQVDERKDVEDAFMSTRQVLAMLSVSSPQAKEYYDILGFFAEAIRRYREQKWQQPPQPNKRYVDQVLSFDTEEAVDQPYLTPSSAQIPPIDMASEISYDDMLANFDTSMGGSTAFADLGQFAAQINDFFPFDYDSLGLDVQHAFS
jgi:hypothetical protein